jgi:CIC family chloride channel protein
MPCDPKDGGIFEVASPEMYIFNGVELPNYLLLGALCALGSLLFIKVLYAAEDIAERVNLPGWLKPVVGAGLLGIMGIVVATQSEHAGVPAFFGNGYPLIHAAIQQDVIKIGFWTLAAGAGLKVLATTFTLGSGGSGGVFAPSLFIGACLGGAFGIALHRIGYIPAESVSAYAIVGMAAVVAGTTHAPLTAIVMLYELTREPKVILPIMFAAIVATGMARYLFNESIYTLKLTRRGVRVGRLADLTILKRVQADQARIITAPIVHPQDPLQKLLDLASHSEANDFVVIEEHSGDYVGMVTADDIKTALLQPKPFPCCWSMSSPAMPCLASSPRKRWTRSWTNSPGPTSTPLPMLAGPDEPHVQGLITRQAVMDRYQEELDERT